MYCDVLRNPIIVGILVGVVVYLFMKHKNEKKQKKNKDKKDKNKHSAFVIPGMAGIIAGFLVWTLNESDKKVSPNNNVIAENRQLIPPEIEINDMKTSMAGGSLNNSIVGGALNNSIVGGASDKMNSYQMIGKGIQVPTNLPDAFLDMDLF